MQWTNKHTCTTPLLPWRNNHPLYPKHWDLWEAEQGFLSLTTKNTFLNLWWCCFRGLKTKLQILIEQVLCSIADDLRNSKEVLWWVNETLKKKRSEVRFPKASLANYGDKFHWTLLVMTELVNELMNEWCIYIALYCVLLYTQSALQSCGGVSPEPPPVCSIHLDDATTATGQRHQCTHHKPATGWEERES